MSRPQSHLDEPPPGHLRIPDLLGALSLAADLSLGLPAEHAIRSCYLGMRIADQLQLAPEQQAGLYYAELLMDAGCTAFTSQLAEYIMGDEIAARRELFYHRDARNPIEVAGWMKDYLAAGQPAHARARHLLAFALHGKEDMREGFRSTCEVAARLAKRLDMTEVVQTALHSDYEQWDGDGRNKARGEKIPIIARIVYATSFLEVFHQLGGRAAVIRLAQDRRGKAFDPSVVDAFLSIASKEALWEGLEQELVWTTVLAMEPQSPHRYLKQEKLEVFSLSFADFADLKSFYSAGHSRRGGDLAERLARWMRLPSAEIATVRRAALMHDLGLVAVPSFTLH